MKKCKICESELIQSIKTIKNIHYHDYKCNENLDHHLYIEREIDGELITLKVRLSLDNEDIIFKINYNECITEIWNTRSEYPEKIIINTILNPDYSDLNKLKSKIKTFIAFS